MWAHYADDHNGIVVQFDGDHPFLSTEDFRGGAVSYRDERPVLSYSNIRSPELFFRKSTEWSYEREWRFVRYLQEADEVIEAEPSPIHLYGLPPDLITGIIIGVGVEHEKRVGLMELCSAAPLEHVTVYQTRLCDKSYKLEIHPPIDGKVDESQISGEICGGRDANGNVDPSIPSLMLMFEVPETKP